MTSVAYNLSKKLEWMGRRLRWIDEAKDLKSWIETMQSVNELMQLVGQNKDEYKDGWRKYTPPVSTQRKTPIKKAEVSGGWTKKRTSLSTALTTRVAVPEKKPQLDGVRQSGGEQIKPPRVELVENAMDVAKAKDPEVQVETAN